MMTKIETETLRIAVITPIPTPYRDPYWDTVARRKDVELEVFYCAAGKADRPWSADWERNYQWDVLPGINLLAWRGSGASLYFNPSVIERLRAGGFDAVIIGGYNHLTMLQAIRHCIKQKIPYFLMCESHLEKRRSSWRTITKRRLVSWAVDNAAGGFPTGTLAQEYLEHYGAKKGTLAHLPNAPDVEGIRKAALISRNERKRTRQALGIVDQPLILFAGRLISKKGAHLLIEAVAELAQFPVVDLLILGDGPERSDLEQLTRDVDLSERVHFTGFVAPAEMSKWYAAADLFVLPSEETWGVVVSEALAAGLPVIVSDQVGCYPDIINDHKVGSVVPSGDISALTESIRDNLLNPLDVDRLYEAWKPVYQRMLYRNLAASMIKHIRLCSKNAANGSVPPKS